MYKFVYGHPFRNPSAFEQYYSGASNVPSGPLRPETANTFELSMERKLTSGLSAIVNLYDYPTHGLLQAAYLDAGLQQIRNTDDVGSSGIEFELSGKAWGRAEFAASLALQRAVFNTTGDRLANSPREVGKVRMALPLLRDKLTLSSSAQYVGSKKYAGGRFGLAGISRRRDSHHQPPVRSIRLAVRCSEPVRPRYYDPVALVSRPHARRRQIRLHQADLAVAGVAVNRCQSSTRRIERRVFLSALAAFRLPPCSLAAGDVTRQAAVIVVFVSGVEAYLEAVNGLRAGLARLVPAPVFIDLKSPQAEAALAEALGTGQQRLVITVGTEALTTVRLAKSMRS